MTVSDIKSKYYNVDVYTVDRVFTSADGVEYTETSTLVTYSTISRPVSSMDYTTVQIKRVKFNNDGTIKGVKF